MTATPSPILSLYVDETGSRFPRQAERSWETGNRFVATFTEHSSNESDDLLVGVLY